jgi:uncharacterized Zn-binding protein involved in type VI secretion
MAAACRLGDEGSGHGPCPPTNVIEASENVFINGKGAARQGDPLAKHCGHSRAIAAGSPNVFVNGKPLARIGDPIDCGGNMTQGSSNVFVNGG